MMIITIISIVLAVTVFVGCYILGNFLIWKYYLDDKMVEDRSNDYINEFQQYVTGSQLFTTDMDKIAGWTGNRYMELIIYKDSQLIYSPSRFEDDDKEPETPTETPTELPSEPGSELSTELGTEVGEDPTENVSNPNGDGAEGGEEINTEPPEYVYGEGRDFRDYLNEDDKREYERLLADILEGNRELSPVVFKDGTLLVTVVDNSEAPLASFVLIGSFVLAFIIMAVIMMIAFSNLTRRITSLASNVKQVEHGAVDIPVYSKGNDEIATLASDINSMRISIVSNMSKEQEAWEANAGLITAMSHDIRTPLTVTMGYLDILDAQTEDETSREYIDICKENTVKLKKLSDDMFQYFLVFGKREIQLTFDSYPAEDVIHHMLDEYIILLTENGYRFENSLELEGGEICVDMTYFGRVIDNIFSNVNKYADKTSPVNVRTYSDGDKVFIEVSNGISTNIAESSEIGIKTCQKIMEQMGGRFTTQKQNGRFIARVSLPISKK